jgi:phosphate transport system permease protein
MTTLADPPRSEQSLEPPPPDESGAAIQSGPLPEVPRKIGGLTTDEVASVGGSLIAALALVWLLFEHVLLWSGTLGFLVCWWLTFLALYTAVSAMSNTGPIVRDRLVSAAVLSAALLVVFALGSAIWYTLWEGRKAIVHLNFYTHDMAGVVPSAPLDQGGISHALAGTAIEVAIATVIALPLGIGTAVYLTEVGGKLAVVVRTVVEAMTALPDILAGLFVYALFIIGLGWDKTGLAVAIALAVTMTPVIARSGEVVLRVVPSGLREASLALGASKWRTVWSVVLPTARAGTATSLILGIARITGETAPLLIVSGSSTFFNDDPTHDPMNSLPLFTFAAIRSGLTGPPVQRAYGAAFVLLIFVLILFVAARFIARDKAAKR